MKDIFEIKLGEEQIRSMSSLALAHIGDAVYELLVRGMLVSGGKVTSTALHRETVSRVSARAQSAAAERVRAVLTDEEASVFRRARNTRVNSVPKSADLSQYHAATALEALFGWLYVRGERERIRELFDIIMEGDHAS